MTAFSEMYASSGATAASYMEKYRIGECYSSAGNDRLPAGRIKTLPCIVDSDRVAGIILDSSSGDPFSDQTAVLAVKADPEDAVEESDEDNNEYYTTTEWGIYDIIDLRGGMNI